MDFFGHRYHGFLDDFIDRCVYLYGGWELHILALLSQLARTYRALSPHAVTYVDVGANTGQHALFMTSHADRVICFEPFEPVRRRLEERIALNQLHNVSVIPIALSAKKGSSSYYPPGGPNQGTGSLMAGFSTGNRTVPIAVATAPGDSFFRQEPNSTMPTEAASGIGILKIDVEGGERGVLEGLRETLLNSRPAVILELSEYTRRDMGTLERLSALLYPEAAFFTICAAPGRLGYQLEPCGFEAPSDILVLPSRLAARIPVRGPLAPAPAVSPGTCGKTPRWALDTW